MMSTEELLKVASLDALGLLDEADRVAFDESFRAAAPHVQAEIRRLQVGAVRIEHTLPNVEPPPGLRPRVLGVLREAIRAVTAVGEPEADPVLAHIGDATRIPHHNTAPLWRAACIGFATASIILGGFSFWMGQEHKQLASSIEDARLMNEVGPGGPGFLNLAFKENSRRLAFARVSDAPEFQNMTIRLVVDSNDDETAAYFYCANMPAMEDGQTFTVRVASVDDGQGSTLLKQFESTATGTLFFRVQLNNVADWSRLVIASPNADGTSEDVIFKMSDV